MHIYVFSFIYRYTHKLTATVWRQLWYWQLHILLHTAVSHLDQFTHNKLEMIYIYTYTCIQIHTQTHCSILAPVAVLTSSYSNPYITYWYTHKLTATLWHSFRCLLHPHTLPHSTLSLLDIFKHHTLEMIYVYIYIYTYTYVYIYIYIHMYTDTHTNSLQHFGASCGARMFILSSIHNTQIHTLLFATLGHH